jgi:hypothetical protein
VVPDLGDYRPCDNCGYNLRGLSFDSPCPECGALYGINADADLLPWEQVEGGGGAGRFIATVLTVVLRPRDLGDRVWVADPIDGRAAIGFRRACVALATLSVAGPLTWLASLEIGWAAGLWLLPLIAAAAVLCFHSFAMHCTKFFKDKGAGSGQRRAWALANYVVAPLALMPLHLVLLAILIRVCEDRNALPALLAVSHGALVVVQIYACAAAEGALLHQIVDAPRGVTLGVALGDIVGRALLGAMYLGGTTALLAIVAGGMAR